MTAGVYTISLNPLSTNINLNTRRKKNFNNVSEWFERRSTLQNTLRYAASCSMSFICFVCWMNEWINGWVNGWMDGWMNVVMNEWMQWWIIDEMLLNVLVVICNFGCYVLYCVFNMCFSEGQAIVYIEIKPIKLRICWRFVCTNPLQRTYPS